MKAVHRQPLLAPLVYAENALCSITPRRLPTYFARFPPLGCGPRLQMKSPIQTEGEKLWQNSRADNIVAPSAVRRSIPRANCESTSETITKAQVHAPRNSARRRMIRKEPERRSSDAPACFLGSENQAPTPRDLSAADGAACRLIECASSVSLRSVSFSSSRVLPNKETASFSPRSSANSRTQP